ncbi:MAG TPA: 4-hydroxy-tetrahydrodipicolinate synthase [Rhizobiaceae bacterium]
MARIDWSGVFVVSVTPFKENGEFDEAATRTLIDTLIEDGVNGIVLAGSTGEWFTMSDEERIELFRVAKDHAKGRVPLLSGISAIATGSAVNLAAASKDMGLDGALLLPPPYILPTAKELDAYVTAVAEVGLPIMLYNNPPRTGVNLDVEWLKKLSRHSSIVAVKESSKDIHQLSAVIREIGPELAVFTGMETYLSPILQRGGAGVVAMAPNVFGSLAIKLHDAVLKGDLAEARRLQDPIDRLYGRMYSGKYNPYVVLKEAMRILGRPGGHPRLPLLPFDAADREELAAFVRGVSA